MGIEFKLGSSVRARMNTGPVQIVTPPDPTVVHSPDGSCTKIYACSRDHYNALEQAGTLEDALYIIVREHDE